MLPEVRRYKILLPWLQGQEHSKTASSGCTTTTSKSSGIDADKPGRVPFLFCIMQHMTKDSLSEQPPLSPAAAVTVTPRCFQSLVKAGHTENELFSFHPWMSEAQSVRTKELARFLKSATAFFSKVPIFQRRLLNFFLFFSVL